MMVVFSSSKLITTENYFIFSARLPKLSTLQITHNRLTDAESIEHLKKCETLRVLDLSHNKLDDPSILDVFVAMKTLVSVICGFVYLNINFNILFFKP